MKRRYWAVSNAERFLRTEQSKPYFLAYFYWSFYFPIWKVDSKEKFNQDLDKIPLDGLSDVYISQSTSGPASFRSLPHCCPALLQGQYVVHF